MYEGAGPVTLADPGRPRPLRVEAEGAGSTVIWNPGPDKARALGDIAPDGFRRFVCIETGAIADRKITVPPAERRVLSVRYLRA